MDVSVGVLIACCNFGRRPLLEDNLMCCLRVLNIMLVVVLMQVEVCNGCFVMFGCMNNVNVCVCIFLLSLVVFLRILCVC